MTRRVRVPPDVARVLELYRELGVAARKGLWLSEKHARAEIEEAARRAERLRRRSG